MNDIIKTLALCMLLPWSLIAYIAWVLWFKPRYQHKRRSYGRINVNDLPRCDIETPKHLQ
jgi:hypothetical protein